MYSYFKNRISFNRNVDHLFSVKDIRNFISDDTFLVRDNNGDSYSIYFDIENQIFEIDNDHSFLSELESSFYSYRNKGSKSNDPYYDRYMYDTQYSWNNHINSCIDSYLHSQICIDTYILSDSDNYSDSDSYIYSSICGESRNSSKSDSSGIKTSMNGSDLTIRESSNDLDVTQKYKHLWVQCENCYGLNYKKFLKSKMNICEQCGYHLKMSSSDRIELSIDPGTWDPLDEDMVSLDPIEFHSDEEPYKDRIDSYQIKTGLTEAVQTGIGQLNGIPIAIGVMDFQFMGGSMGSVVGE
ncbi:acetyl-coenzyme A carboxylase carboxyl transferase subunit beta, chloroplastic-like, partial [Cornus florida]|uniref:acetyl-coenzyme A carboxylase carboxyl transferase subunit beta, chloroplastic-like n=1 Tax=Cornus florida TaxID=4283 RepID=UPI00289F70D0